MTTETTIAPSGAGEPILFCLDLSAGGMTDAVTMGQGYPTTVNDLPAHYRWADALKIGDKYTHPTKGYEVDASPATVKKIEDSFAKMKANRVESPFVKDHKVEADRNLGYVWGTRRKDGWLQVQLQILGDDSLNVARKNKISLGLQRNMKDGRGNVYEFGIQHCAATPLPVVAGQGELKDLSATDNSEPIYLFSASLPQANSDDLAASRADSENIVCSPSDAQESPRSNPMKKEHRDRALKILSGAKDLSADADDDTLLSRLLDDHEATATDLKNQIGYCQNLSLADAVEASKDKENPYFVNLAREVAEMDELAINLGRELDEAKAEVVTLSRDPEPTPAGKVMEAKHIAYGYDALTEARGFTPALVDKWKTLAFGSTENPNLTNLSLSDGEDDCMAGKMLDLLREMGGFKPGPKAGEQGITNMSRQQDSETAADNVVTPERKAQILGTIGLTPTLKS